MRISDWSSDVCSSDLRGQPLGGLRLSQDSQAGKSATFGRVKQILADQRAEQRLPPNDYQVLIVGLDKKTSLKSVFQDVLLEMHDPDWSTGTEKEIGRASWRERGGRTVENPGVPGEL